MQIIHYIDFNKMWEYYDFESEGTDIRSVRIQYTVTMRNPFA